MQPSAEMTIDWATLKIIERLVDVHFEISPAPPKPTATSFAMTCTAIIVSASPGLD